jgi:hypothetical protein
VCSRSFPVPDRLGSRFNALWTRGTDSCARLLALVGLLFQPSLDGFPAVPHVTTHPVADWAVALVPPAVQGVNEDANISETSVSDISLSPAWSVMIIFLFVDRTRVQSLGGSAVRSTGRGQATVKDLSREPTAGGRKSNNKIELAWLGWKVATAVLAGGHRVVCVRLMPRATSTMTWPGGPRSAAR